MNIYAIDPSGDGAYVALSEYGNLTRVFHVAFGDPPWQGQPVKLGLIVYEKPRILKQQTRGKDPNDIVDLALQVGWAACATWCYDRWMYDLTSSVSVKGYTPHEWKAQVKKHIHHDRLWSILRPEEKALFPADTESRIQRAVAGGPYRSKVHNYLDAAALNLFAAGRFGRGGGNV